MFPTAGSPDREEHPPRGHRPHGTHGSSPPRRLLRRNRTRREGNLRLWRRPVPRPVPLAKPNVRGRVLVRRSPPTLPILLPDGRYVGRRVKVDRARGLTVAHVKVERGRGRFPLGPHLFALSSVLHPGGEVNADGHSGLHEEAHDLQYRREHQRRQRGAREVDPPPFTNRPGAPTQPRTPRRLCTSPRTPTSPPPLSPRAAHRAAARSVPSPPRTAVRRPPHRI